jgi:hypothetical protein
VTSAVVRPAHHGSSASGLGELGQGRGQAGGGGAAAAAIDLAMAHHRRQPGPGLGVRRQRTGPAQGGDQGVLQEIVGVEAAGQVAGEAVEVGAVVAAHAGELDAGELGGGHGRGRIAAPVPRDNRARSFDRRPGLSPRR